MPYKLVPDSLSHDTVEALKALYEGAVAGEVKGLAFAAMLRKYRYITNVAGLAYLNPTFSRGMIATLDDELAGMVHERDPGDTR